MTEEQKNVVMKCHNSGLGYGATAKETGLTKGAVRMTDEQFRAEKLYYISLSIAKSMLRKGVINEEVLAVIDTKLLEKYRPISGTLLAGKPLT